MRYDLKEALLKMEEAAAGDDPAWYVTETVHGEDTALRAEVKFDNVPEALDDCIVIEVHDRVFEIAVTEDTANAIEELLQTQTDKQLETASEEATVVAEMNASFDEEPA